MSWDEEDFKPPTDFGAPADQWEGEDADLNNVKDSWDVSSGEEEAQAEVKSEKKTKQQRIDEKKEKRRLEELKKAESQKKEESRRLTAEEELEEKRRHEELVRQSDLEMAEDLFGGAAEKGEKEKRVPIELMNPTDADGFDKLREAIVAKILQYEKRSDFLPFLQRLCLDCCEELNVESIKQIASSLNALATEKQRQAKSQKTKKKGKALVSGKAVSKLDMERHDDYVDDYDDFM
ncbi:eukaryotic translation initiation factor 3 subunit J-like [Oscarella lobularis]|uniref:eukaryotic translation initiation factor 3 subunit J-like n=1 Tax=Oscarella lobularis TaxID=121494 RepID=UPI0033140021